MITLLHGDNTTASRNEYHRIRTELQNKDIRLLDGKTISDEDLIGESEIAAFEGALGADHGAIFENDIRMSRHGLVFHANVGPGRVAPPVERPEMAPAEDDGFVVA